MGLLCVNTNILQIITASDEKLENICDKLYCVKNSHGCQKSLQREMKRFKREFDEVYENNSLVDCCHPALHLLMCLQYSKFDKNNMRKPLPGRHHYLM